MANGAQQLSKINVINSSATTMPNSDTIPKPTFSTIPISTAQQGLPSHCVRVPMRRNDMRMPNRIIAPRLETGANNPVRSNLILNVQPQPRARVVGTIPHTNLQYTSLPGPVHITQLRAVSGMSVRPGPNTASVNQYAGAQITSRPNLNSTTTNLNLNYGPPQAIPRTFETVHGAPRSEGPSSARLQASRAETNALHGERIIGETFQVRRGREPESTFEQPDADSDAAWPKRQKLSANVARQEEYADVHTRVAAPSDQTLAGTSAVKAKRPVGRPSAAARQTSNVTDYSDSESESQFGSSQSQSAVAASISQASFANAAVNPLAGATAVTQQRAPARNDAAQRRACNCSRSHCLKLYCECFAHSQFCSNCNCVDCHNTVTFESDRSAAIAATLERNPHAFQAKVGTIHGERRHTKGCNCKRSNCLKNYCECYEAKIACTSRCKCVECQNYRDSEAIDVQYRSARTRRLFNFDRAVQSVAMPGHFAIPERSGSRSRGGASSGSMRSAFGGMGRLTAAERSSARMRAPRNRETGFDRNFEFGDEHDEADECAPSGTQSKSAPGAANIKHPGSMRSRDLHILPSDLRVRSIVAREQARQRVLPHELISDEIVEATAVCLIAQGTSQSNPSNDTAQSEATKHEKELEHGIIEEYGRCMQHLIALAKRKQDMMRFGSPYDAFGSGSNDLA